MKDKITNIITVIVFMLISVLVIVGVVQAFSWAENTDTQRQKQNKIEATKPTDDVSTGDWKYVGQNLYKICDGPNLIYGYAAKAITVSPNDPECRGK